jgi:hypothetical protein
MRASQLVVNPLHCNQKHKNLDKNYGIPKQNTEPVHAVKGVLKENPGHDCMHREADANCNPECPSGPHPPAKVNHDTECHQCTHYRRRPPMRKANTPIKIKRTYSPKEVRRFRSSPFSFRCIPNCASRRADADSSTKELSRYPIVLHSFFLRK